MQKRNNKRKVFIFLVSFATLLLDYIFRSLIKINASNLAQVVSFINCHRVRLNVRVILSFFFIMKRRGVDTAIYIDYVFVLQNILKAYKEEESIQVFVSFNITCDRYDFIHSTVTVFAEISYILTPNPLKLPFETQRAVARYHGTSQTRSLILFLFTRSF